MDRNVNRPIGFLSDNSRLEANQTAQGERATAQRTRPPAGLLFVDAYPAVRLGLRAAVSGEADLRVCAEADEPYGALAAAALTRPDLVVTGLTFPAGMLGFELIKDLRRRHSRLAVLVLSMHDERLYALRALRGAMGYVSKREPCARVVEAIRRVLSGEISLSPSASTLILTNRFARTPQAPSPIEALSDRELEVYDLIGRGRSIRQIAHALHLSTKTIESHRHHIKRKILPRPASPAAVIVSAIRFVGSAASGADRLLPSAG